MKTIIAVAVSLELLLSLSRAENITARDGTIYKNVEVTAVEYDGLRVIYADGTAKLYFEDLPPDIQKKYNYDPAKVAAIRKQIADAAAAQVKADADAKAALARQQGEERNQEEAARQEQTQSAQRTQTAAQEERDRENKNEREQESAQNARTAVLLIVLGIVGLFIYFLPTIMASYRAKRNVLAIFVLNFFLGWFLIPWVVALVWACAHDE